MWIRRVGQAAFIVLLIALAWRSATRPVDFPIYHRVATEILHGTYDFYSTTPRDRGPAHSFRYAPAVAFLFVPFGWLPLEAAAFLFFSLKVAAFVYVGKVVARQLDVPQRYRALMLASLIVVGGYLVEEFRNGNFHFFTVALMVLAFDAAERGKVAVPAAALAIAIAAKLTPVVLLAYFACRRRFALCLATVVALALFWLLPIAVVGYDTNNRLVGAFVQSAVQKIDEQDNYALRGVMLRYLTADEREDPTYPRTSLSQLPAPVVSVLWVAMVCAGGLALVTLLWREPSGSANRFLEFSLVLTAMLIASPHTQRQHLTALCVPVMALVALMLEHPALPLRVPVRIALAVTAATSTLLPLVVGDRRRALQYEAGSPYFFALVLLFVVLALLTTRLKAERDALTPAATRARRET